MNQQPTPPSGTPPTEVKPVAYDSEGRPLYAAPPAQTAPTQVVHLSRAVTPVKPEVSPLVKARHDESQKQFPTLNLSESEFIINAVRRHPIGLFVPVAITVLMVSLVLSILVNFPAIASELPFFSSADFGSIVFGGLLLVLLFLLGGYIAIWVYMNNRFFLTNESVIQEIQTSLFSHHEQTVSLNNIEDASYEQRGIIQMIFNYGSIRLSTEGDETTYRFSYVANPKKQIATLNNVVEAFKNGRPIDED
jgi:hypothetical protein